ncbi:MAG: putative metal-binding motif-containing protein [Pseudomonadota bacterium]|nr:putative metal-binding motif-containing protein [Pseudomonadota bacterium]
MLLMSLSLASAETDTIGGDDVENNDSAMMKLVAIEVTDAAVVTNLEFAASGRSSEDFVLVLYVLGDTGYRLADQAAAAEITGGWATSGDVTWLLEPGETYALGAYVGDGYSYAYDEGRSASPWFGDVFESYRVEDRAGVPDTFRPDGEDYYYLMRITSEDADADDDGALAAAWGGTDCDDTDPSVVTASTEIPYDGIDQDCDGVDLVDADADGVPAIEAGGADCDDTTGAVAPSRTEVCGDGVDNDCFNGDEACDTGLPFDGGEGDGVVIRSGCGCASTPPAPGLAALGLLALATLRRRARR